MSLMVLGVILIILILLMLLPVKLYARYSGELAFSVSVAGIRIKRGKKKDKGAPEKKGEPSEKEEQFKKDASSLTERITRFADTFSAAARLTKKFFHVEKFIVQIEAGTGDAASTAIGTGVLWAAVYNVISLLGRAVYIDKPSVEITPDYKNAVFKAYAKCIISTRIAYIIFIGIVILLKIARKGKEE